MFTTLTLCTKVANFWSLLISAVTLVVLTGSAAIALKQLMHMRKARDLEFLKHINDRLFARERMLNRRRIYETIPIPERQKDRYNRWKNIMLAKSKTKERYAFCRGVYKVLEQELGEFEQIAIYLKEGRLSLGPFLMQWFNVLARLTALTTDWIINEVTLRGRGYLPHTVWLFQKNYEYLKSANTRNIKMWHFDTKGRMVSMDFKIEIVECAIRKLRANMPE